MGCTQQLVSHDAEPLPHELGRGLLEPRYSPCTKRRQSLPSASQCQADGSLLSAVLGWDVASVTECWGRNENPEVLLLSERKPSTESWGKEGSCALGCSSLEPC